MRLIRSIRWKSASSAMARTRLWRSGWSLHVDNNPCQADIYEVWVDNAANLAGPCGFISYANKATSQAHISFKAYHRNQFATFDFTVVKGSTGEVAAASAHGPVGVPVNGFANNPATGVFTQDVPVSDDVGC